MTASKEVAIERMTALQETVAQAHKRSTYLSERLADLLGIRDLLMKEDLTPEETEAMRVHQLASTLVSDLSLLSNYYNAQIDTATKYTQTNQEAAPSPAIESVNKEQVPPSMAPAVAPPARRAPGASSSAATSSRSNEERLIALNNRAREMAEQTRIAEQKQRERQQAQREAAEKAAAEKAAREEQEQKDREEAAKKAASAQARAQAPAVNKPARPTTVITAKPRVLNAYERLMSPEHSPLIKFFAPSPWFPQGRGTVTVGSVEEFGEWHQGHEVDVTDFNRTVTLPSGFYGDNNGMPAVAVIRLKTTVLVWRFSFDEGSAHLFFSTMNPTPEDLQFRVLETCSSSAIRRCLQELGEVYGMEVNSALVVESAVA